MTWKTAIGPALAVVALLAAACGGGTSAAQGSGGPSLAITAPSDGTSVTAPFEVKFSTNEPLGPPESGNDHIHLSFDGNTEDYEVVTGSSVVVSDLSPGKHTLEASLRNADHSAAGADDAVTVTVASGGDDGEQNGGGNGGKNGGDGGGYGDY